MARVQLRPYLARMLRSNAECARLRLLLPLSPRRAVRRRSRAQRGRGKRMMREMRRRSSVQRDGARGRQGLSQRASGGARRTKMKAVTTVVEVAQLLVCLVGLRLTHPSLAPRRGGASVLRRRLHVGPRPQLRRGVSMARKRARRALKSSHRRDIACTSLSRNDTIENTGRASACEGRSGVGGSRDVRQPQLSR